MTMALICLESLTRIDSRLADDWRTKVQKQPGAKRIDLETLKNEV